MGTSNKRMPQKAAVMAAQEDALRRLTHDLGERLKELSCLYAISSLRERLNVSTEETFGGIVDLIPAGWQYPEITCARIVLEGQEFRTDNFEETAWKQVSDVNDRGHRIGSVEVRYLEEKPRMDEGPFLMEERNLINAIAERLGSIVERDRAEEELRRSQQELSIRNKIDRAFLTISDDEMYGEVLRIILEATGSDNGFFGYVDENGAFVCPSMTRDVWDRCQIPDKNIVFPRERWGGIWGQALAERKTLCSNHPFHVPEGHIPIDRALAVPIVNQEQLVGGIIVGNKKTDYDRRDKELLEAIAAHMAPVLNARLQRDRHERKRREAADALQKARDELEVRVRERTSELAKANEGLKTEMAERQRAESQLLLSGRLAAIGEIASGVAHELNNPLAAMQGFAQLIASRDDLDETMRSDVETILKEARRASRITGNLLSFARRHDPEKKMISINNVIEDSIELNAYRMKVNNMEIVQELAPALPDTAGDFHQLQQVFVNLLTNAEQAMTEAHGKGRILVKTQTAGNKIQVAFSDDGPGIPEENLKSIFDPFFTTKEVGQGTGLGLSICYGIVEQHGGTIQVKSKVGEGTTFVVEIPIVTADQAMAEQAGSIQAE